MSEAARNVQSLIDVEKSKPKKDYGRLQQLKITLRAQLALDAERKLLETELAAAEERDEYITCGELVARLEQMAVTVEVPLDAAAQVIGRRRLCTVVVLCW